MKSVRFFAPTLLFLCLIWSCEKRYNEPIDRSVVYDSLSFVGPVDSPLIHNDKIEEASGLAASRLNKKAFWTHNDSGGKPQIYLVGEKGGNLAIVKLKGKKVHARDWEDIALGPGPKDDQPHVYVADIGDNDAKYKHKEIYRFKEPKITLSSIVQRKTVKEVDVIRYKYPDGKRDAETIMIDPLSRDIYVLSKREDSVRVYRMPNPVQPKGVYTLERVGTLHFTKANAGDISPDGTKILVKNYANVYYWEKAADESPLDAFKRKPVRLTYQIEPQGESIAWTPDGQSFFTLSEERFDIPARLYKYQKRDAHEKEKTLD